MASDPPPRMCGDCRWRNCSNRCQCWCHKSDAEVRREGELAAARSEGRREGWAEAVQALRAAPRMALNGKQWHDRAADYLESIIGGTPEATE